MNGKVPLATSVSAKRRAERTLTLTTKIVVLLNETILFESLRGGHFETDKNRVNQTKYRSCGIGWNLPKSSVHWLWGVVSIIST